MSGPSGPSSGVAGADSVVGFKHRLANYFERSNGDISHLKGILDPLSKAYSSPESQDTLMRFISDRLGVEEAEAAEELDYVTIRLERERRNERFEHLLDPWTTEQLEASLRQFFLSQDPSQLPTVSALVTFYRGREITLIRELELQYRKPLLLHREDEETREEEAGALEMAQAASLMPVDGKDDLDDDLSMGNDDDDPSSGGGGDPSQRKRNSNKLKSSQDVGDLLSSTGLDSGHGSSGELHGGGSGSSLRRHSNSATPPGGSTSNLNAHRGGGVSPGTPGGKKKQNNNNNNNSSATTVAEGVAHIRSNVELTVDSMQQFEMEILKFLLDIRQELHDRIKESELLAQQFATAAASGELSPNTVSASVGGDGNTNNNNSNTHQEGGDGSSSSSPMTSPRRKSMLRKTSTIRRAIANAQRTTNETTTTKEAMNTSTTSNPSLDNNNKKGAAAAAVNEATKKENIAASVNELTKELAALPRKRLVRVEKLLQIIPLVARAVTPIFKSQLFIYLGFYCSLRLEARKVMQKRIAGHGHDAPLKADENFQRRVATLIVQEKEARSDAMMHERKVWSTMDPLFYRVMFQRLRMLLIDEELEDRQEIEFDEMCVSSVARAKLRSLAFIEKSYVDLNSHGRY